MKKLLMILIILVCTQIGFSQKNKIKFGDVYVGLNRTTLLTQPITKDKIKNYNLSVLAVFPTEVNKVKFSVQTQLIVPFSKSNIFGKPLLRVGVSVGLKQFFKKK